MGEVTCVDGLAASLQQQQLVKGLKDVDGGLVNGTHNSAACVDNVAHSPHHNGCCPCIQPCTSKGQVQARPDVCCLRCCLPLGRRSTCNKSLQRGKADSTSCCMGSQGSQM